MTKRIARQRLPKSFIGGFYRNLDSVAAFKTYSINALNEDADYVEARYSAAQTRALARLNALISELTSNYAKEAELDVSRSGAYAPKKNAAKACVDATQFSKLKRGFGVTSATYSERNAYFDGIVSASSQVASLKSAADSQDESLETQNESTLAATKSANETTRENAEEAADDAYAATVENAWKNAYLAQLALGVTLIDAYEATAATFNSALDAAAGDLRDAAFAAWDELDSEFEEYARILNYQDMRANLGLTVPADAFEDLIFDFEVCFAAGTPILMADGSKKPIEEIQPGDVVLAADHLSPEGTPAPACVARTFDTGLKDVVRLRFEGGEELVCTPSHRFYVSDRGWVCAESLQAGDLCVTANGDKVAFVERETLSEKAGVFNFEVEGRHTYFVGELRNLFMYYIKDQYNQFIRNN